MAALIYVDLDSVHPVVDGVWHRARFQSMPQSGQAVTMLCGLAAAIEYERLDSRRDHGTPTCCYGCDTVYRKQRGIPVRQAPPVRGTR